MDTTSDEAPEGYVPPLTPREKKLIKAYTGLYSGLGALLAGFRTLPGLIIMNGAEDRATELVKFARHHPKFLERLEKFLEANDQMQFAMGHGLMFFAILVSVDRIKLSERVAAVLSQTGYDELVKVKQAEELQKQQQGAQYGAPVAA